MNQTLMNASTLETVLATGRYVALAQARGGIVRVDSRGASGSNLALDRRTNSQNLRRRIIRSPIDLSASHTWHTVWTRFLFGLDPCSTKERPSPTHTDGPPARNYVGSELSSGVSLLVLRRHDAAAGQPAVLRANSTG
jgi:hypothetical protein